MEHTNGNPSNHNVEARFISPSSSPHPSSLLHPSPSSRPPRTPNGAGITTIITLALWQLRETWRLLLFTGAGMVVATVLVCTLPLYSEVALTAGLRAVVNANPANSSLLIQGNMQSVSADTISQMTLQLKHALQNDLGSLVNPQPQLFAQITRADIYPSNPALSQGQPIQTTDSAVALQSFAQDQLASHVTLLQGRLPQPAQSVTEIALTPQTASAMHLTVNDTLYVAAPISLFANGISTPVTWQLRVVGLFTPHDVTDTFWQGNTFGSQLLGTVNPDSYLYSVLTSNEALFAALDQTATAHPAAHIDTYNPPFVSWNYHLDAAQMDAAHINTLTNGLNTFQTTTATLNSPTGIQLQAVTEPITVLNEYSIRSSLAQIPQGVLLLLVIGMVLLFIGLMINLLMEQRIDAIALLRSRGASRRQIFGAFTAQALVLGLPVLIIGPLLAIPTARLLVLRLLSPSDQPALNLIGGNPLRVGLSLWPFALAAVGVTVLATLLALFQATTFDTLALRHEAARPTRRPFWQRSYLDVLFLLLALAGYGYTLYLNHTGTLDAQTSIQVVSPLVLASSALFLLATLLLFLRFFARLSQRAAHLAAHQGRGAGSMLALAQIARTPRQATRMLLLLTLTTAFALFALMFSASQTQRINAIASYEAGADLSGRFLHYLPTLDPSIPTNQAVQNALIQQNSSYSAIPGVLSATIGYMGPIYTTQSVQLTIKAVDATTYAQTAAWTGQDSQQPLNSLMAQLLAHRPTALANHIVPAIVDAVTWDNLHLSNGKLFNLQLSVPNPSNPQTSIGTTVSFLALAEVQHIPTLSDSSAGNDPTSNAGILVDYLSGADGFAHATPFPEPMPASYVWLHTRADAVASVRSVLAKRLAPGLSVADRRDFASTLLHDPLSIDLGGILALGTFTPLVLAVIGSLLASWQNARARLLNFVLLRALGTTPRQLAGVLSWEQGVIYLLMLGLGVLAGILLSAMVLPVLVVTSIANIDTSGSTVTSGASIQQVLPSITISIPSTLGIVLALLVVVCVLAQVMMVRIIVRPSLSETLRLNAD